MTAMGWVSAVVIRLEQRNVESQKRAALEEVVRLALWRMDSAVSSLIVEESARPYFEYSAFNPGDAVPNAGLMLEAINGYVPSPLLTQTPSNVLVYFNSNFDGGPGYSRITSPQVPEEPFRQLACDNYAGVASQIGRNDGNLIPFTSKVTVADLALAMNVQLSDGEEGQSVQSVSGMDAQQGQANPQAQQPAQQMVVAQTANQQWDIGQALINTREWSARRGQYERVQSKADRTKQSLYSSIKKVASSLTRSRSVKGPQPSPVPLPPPAFASAISEDIMKPVWVNDALILARQVTIDGARSIQGVWLNWETIQADLLREIRDILPHARLRPALGAQAIQQGRRMASLPVQLDPGEPAIVAAVIGSPLRLPMTVAWIGVFVASIAVGIVLFGAVSLSEKRAAFVSAVTHELRTPLTTFQMYAEMLEQGMVTGPEQQREYLGTLRAEGERLKHLVENVLSYSRIERGKAGGHPESVTLGQVIDRSLERLDQRAQQAGMEISTDCSKEEGITMRVDPAMLEQILFNLVDNACKYAVNPEDPRIHIESVCKPRALCIRVRDHGPGIDRTETRRLFRPFHKSARTAAETAPGVGLGLSLSRRLARQMGGDLRVDTGCRGGACFELVIPRAR
jgi:signal transduction histidine kinase